MLYYVSIGLIINSLQDAYYKYIRGYDAENMLHGYVKYYKDKKNQIIIDYGKNTYESSKELIGLFLNIFNPKK